MQIHSSKPKGVNNDNYLSSRANLFGNLLKGEEKF